MDVCLRAMWGGRRGQRNDRGPIGPLKPNPEAGGGAAHGSIALRETPANCAAPLWRAADHFTSVMGSACVVTLPAVSVAVHVIV